MSKLVIHHRDGNPLNNDLSNLAFSFPWKNRKDNEMKIEVGKWYKDSRGYQHEIVHYNLKADFFVSSYGNCFDRDGRNRDGEVGTLIEEWKEPKSGTYWMNIYDRNEYSITRGTSESKMDADNHARNCVSNKRIACIRVEWKEGQFDE